MLIFYCYDFGTLINRCSCIFAGEVSRDDTRSVVVHFSPSDEFFSKFQSEGNECEVYNWPIPDFMTASLFVDFAKEIVDAFVKGRNNRFLQLLQDSPQLDERDIWLGGDEDLSNIVRKICQSKLQGRIVPSPESGIITSIDVLMNEETDPSREIRRGVKQTLADYIIFDEELKDDEESIREEDVDVEDEYSSDEEEINEELQANPEKPCYYPSQIEMAFILKKRIHAIMRYYHKTAKLKDAFDDVDFVVFTARYRMLSDQTEKRIRHPDAGVLPKEELEANEESDVRKRIFMYLLSKETEMHFDQLKQSVQQNPRTLFVIIADECHWGITRDKEGKTAAHNLYINGWCKENSPSNVLVVQISATPFNLLTGNSRLPKVQCVISDENTTSCSAGDLLVLETGIEEVKQISKKVELHVVHWSEVELNNFERGMRMKLKSTLYTDDAENKFRYLQVSSQGNLGVTASESDATEFVVEGRHGIVIIKALVNNRIQVLTADEYWTLTANADLGSAVEFEVKLDFGVGVVSFSCREKEDHFLAVDENDCVTLQAAKVERKGGVAIMKPKHPLAKVSFQFYLDQYGPTEVSRVGQQYVSLNYYLSTMACHNTRDQKIREDPFFQDIVDKAKRQRKSKTESFSFEIDALLCAEYCFHILHASVYDTADKIRKVLESDHSLTPASEFARKLQTFSVKLKQDNKSIGPEAFELVKRGIVDRVTKSFKESVKEFSRMAKPGNANDNEKKSRVLSSYVEFLMFLSPAEQQEVTQEKREAAIIEDVKQALQKDGGQKLINKWNDLLQEYETSLLIKNLIESGKGQLGKMKIVRAKSMKTANQFFHTLRLARAIASLKERFEIIRDYGGIQIQKQLMKSSSPFFAKLQPVKCQYKFDCCCNELQLQSKRKKCLKCEHVHKSITQYEDLENLACILILVDKGRMGDTFPQSFDCLDLRLNYDSSKEFKEGSPLYLSSIIQELGRMCRYAKHPVGKSHVEDIPYVLVGRELYKRLENSLQSSPSMNAIKCSRIDRYMTRSDKSHGMTILPLRWHDYEAHKDSYDHENTQIHCNRILLQAEPQIGKTGTYLCLIKLLRQEILGNEEIPCPTAYSFDEGTFYHEKLVDTSEELRVEESVERQDWEYPYWKTVEEAPSLLEKKVVPGKYSFGGCYYTHECEENPFILMKRAEQQQTKFFQLYEKTACASGIRAWHWYHFESCARCGRLLQGQDPYLETIWLKLDGKSIRVECSIPASRPPYRRLKNYLRAIVSAEGITQSMWDPEGTDIPILPFWIFHPSHRDDPRKCLLNYSHVMEEASSMVSYVQVAVVRSGKFQAYKATWGRVLAIFQLPEELPNCELGPEEGGVGYARLFIQKVASALNLEYVFVMDDNVAMMSEAEFTDCTHTSNAKVLRDGKGMMKMKPCSFFKPLGHLQKIVEGREIRPNFELPTHPLSDHFVAQKFPLYSHTGPAKLFADKKHESYGVLGLLRSVPNVKGSFAKTQVYAVILLNVQSTVEKKVFYRPWPVWEDLRFNDDCDKAGLWVVKCNRYHFLKVHYKDWMQGLLLPRIFHWRDESVLQDRPLATQLAEDLEKKIILEHLENLLDKAGSHRCFKGHVGYDQQNVAEKDLPTVKLVDELKVSSYSEKSRENEIPVLVVSYCASNREFERMAKLNHRFCTTKERIALLVSAEDAVVRWPSGLTLAKVPTHDGICFSDNMRDRNAQFHICSAADPNRHQLRWVLIEAVFPFDEDEGGETFEKDMCNTQWERGVKSAISTDYSSRDGDNASKCAGSNKPLAESFQDTKCSQEVRVYEVSRHSPSPSRSPLEKPTKRRKIEDFYETRNVVNDTTWKVERKEESGQETFQVNQERKGKKNSNLKTSGNWKLREDRMACGESSSVDRAQEDVEMPHVRKQSTTSISDNEESEKIKTNLSDSKHVRFCSVDSSQDEEMEVDNAEENCNTITTSQATLQGEYNAHFIDGTGAQENQTSSLKDGNSRVTRAVVVLWEKYTSMRRTTKEDLKMEFIRNSLDDFTIEELEKKDDQGYNAILKACSLPSMSPHVMQYLIGTRKVDLNCTLPPDFDKTHQAASGLVPGMSPLSVAINRSCSRYFSTFMTREAEIKVRSADENGNTALHHCVLKASKIVFQKLFPLYKPLEWTEMRNRGGRNPLDLVINNKPASADGSSQTKKKTALEYMRNEMEQ